MPGIESETAETDGSEQNPRAPRNARDKIKQMLEETRAAAEKKKAFRERLTRNQRDYEESAGKQAPGPTKPVSSGFCPCGACFGGAARMLSAPRQDRVQACPAEGEQQSTSAPATKLDADTPVDSRVQADPDADMPVDKEPDDKMTEEEARNIVLSKCVTERQGASQAAKRSGRDWATLSWKERLSYVNDYTGAGSSGYPQSTSVTGPPGDEVEKQAASEKALAEASGQPKRGTLDRSVRQKAAARNVSAPLGGQSTASTSGRGRNVPAALRRNATVPSTSSFASMTREQLIEYAIDDDDLLLVAGGDKSRIDDMYSFAEQLVMVPDSLQSVEVVKYLAKGSRGWVFLGEQQPSSAKIVLKVVRMTQADACLKEWYASKVLRDADIPNVVLTEESVQAFARVKAPGIIEKELKDAGPVPYYVCMFQEFMSGGTLENFVKEGRLCVDLMFKVLVDVASTLALMHASHMQHRDIKPENVLLEISEKGKDTVVVAKLADFGSAEIGDRQESRADDIRRFGVMMFSLATGEGWNENNLIKEGHDALVQRLTDALPQDACSKLRPLPQMLRKILAIEVTMQEVVKQLEGARNS